jgi:hypothetical protein
MELNNLSPKQMTEPRDQQLATLFEKYLDALQSAIRLSMNEEEADEYDQSHSRMGELCELLEEFVDDDVRNWS